MSDHQYRVESSSPVVGELMFWCLAGYECLGRPSVYELRVLSENEAVDPKKVLGHAFDVVIGFEDADGGSHERHAQGHAVRVERMKPVGRYFQYHITLRSWFWLLSRRVNSRIFQEQDVLQVFDTVVDSTPLKAVKKLERGGVIGSHPTRRYCVQHQERDDQFLMRLLEDEGIYGWFDAHEAPGTMHLADTSAVAHHPLPAQPTLRLRSPGTGWSEMRFNEIEGLKPVHQAASGGYASRDSDFKAIRKQLSGDKSDPDAHELADFEVFEFPGGFFSGDDTQERARIRMEELAARRQLYHGCTGWPDVAAGRRFTFDNAGSAGDAGSGDYLIGNCVFGVQHPGYEGMDPKPGAFALADDMTERLQDHASGDPLDPDGVHNLIVATLAGMETGVANFGITVLPAEVPYRPPRLALRRPMPGPQSAIVVGPEGEEIHADSHGRVKVQFHWDRYGESDENSTCWVRVSQPWAGKGWGGYFIPRIGQEVLVDFINGDPDRPVIVGRLYNDDQPIPFDRHEQSGFRTRSTPGGNASNCNEFRFDDSKGKEQVYLHAERNQDIEVEADETHWVGHDRKKTIGNDETSHIKNNRKETVDVDETIDIGANRKETVGGNEDITVAGNRTESVGGNESVTIGANRDLTVGANESVTVGASRTESIAANLTQTIGAAATQTVGATLTQTAGGAVTIASGGPMTLNAAGGLNIIAPGGTKVVDYQFLQFGGDEKVGYATSLNFSVINTEINSVKGEITGITNAFIPIKFEKVGLENKEAAAEIKALAASIASGATKIVSKAISMFL